MMIELSFFNTGFTDIDVISKFGFINKFDGIFADLGVSSFQLDNVDSGFTYRENTKLDLRMNKTKGIPAYEVINKYKQEELADIFLQIR